VRRDSAQAKTIVIRQAANGLDVSGRQLEEWDRDDLLPLPGISPAEERWHYAALIELNKGRMTADAKALALARRHRLGCNRFRDAMMRACVPGCESVADFVAGVGPEPLEPIDTDTDKGDEELHTLAQEWEGPAGLSELIDEVSASFRPEAGAAPVIDPVTYSGSGLDPGQEAPEQVAESFVLNIGAAVFGSGIYSDEPFVSLAGGELDEHQEQLVDALGDGGLSDGIVQLFVSAPVSTLVAVTALMGRMMGNFPTVKEEQKDRFAAVMTPGFLTWLMKLGPDVAAEMLRRIFEPEPDQTELSLAAPPAHSQPLSAL